MATLVRWDPFREATALQNELSRMMNGLFEGNGRQTQAWVPMLDAWETEGEIVYAFDLPGVAQDKISVEVENDALTVSAERERTKEVSQDSFHRFERRFGTFARTVGLPQGASEDDIQASYTDGVLEVHIPKPAQPKPKKISVGVGVGGQAGQKTIEGTSSKS
jgi:HSP20 family protein